MPPTPLPPIIQNPQPLLFFRLGPHPTCSLPPAYARAVIVLIDALRFDFAEGDVRDTQQASRDRHELRGVAHSERYPSLSASEYEGYRGSSNSTKQQRRALPPYLNRMPSLHSAIKDSPDRAALFRFFADSPTTTAQVLRVLLT